MSNYDSYDPYEDENHQYWPGDGVPGPYGGPQTSISDAVMVNAQISALSFRVHCVLRAVVSDTKRSTAPQALPMARLRETIPGTDGAPITAEELQSVFSELESAGLLVPASTAYIVPGSAQGPEVAR